MISCGIISYFAFCSIHGVIMLTSGQLTVLVTMQTVVYCTVKNHYMVNLFG